MRLAAIKFKYDLECPSCKTKLARRTQLSLVYDQRGDNVILMGPVDPTKELYEIECDCGHVIELEGPREVEPQSVPDDFPCGGPPATLIV